MTSILFRIVRISKSWFKYNYLKNERHFVNFLSIFCNINQILNILKKKLIVLAHVFPKLKIGKDLVRQLSKKVRFRRSFDSQHVKGSQIRVKSQWEHFYHIFSSLWGELIWKISPLLLCEILREFFNTVTADDKYLFQDCENLQLLIQMQLS